MDELMAEATDLILSPAQNLIPDTNKTSDWESRRPSQDATDMSSITLLRKSITRSIKERRSQSEVVDINSLKQKKGKRRRESYSGKSQPNAQFTKFRTENSDIMHAKDRRTKESTDEQKFDEVDNSLEQLFAERSDPDAKRHSDVRETDTVENDQRTQTTVTDKEKVVRKNIVENGLKLAGRKFSNTIFENCSTYGLTCPEVLQERDSSSPLKENLAEAGNHQSSADKSTKIECGENEKTSADNAKCSDDPISLSDSFFVRVNNGEDNASQTSLFESESPGIGKLSSRFSLSKENDLPASENDSEQRSLQKSERRLSKKWRKRQRKNKSKDAPTYECPKCGVSYILSPSASNNATRCLHCDFWQSVEPVFLKQEKQPWNTCRIC